MWSNGVALASKTSVKVSARLFKKLQRCPIPRCFSLVTKVMHIINPYMYNTLRRFVHVYMDFQSSTGRLETVPTFEHALCLLRPISISFSMDGLRHAY